MAIYYVDLVSGDDGTGDGTSGNPYLTVDHANDQVDNGDEVRIAKTTAPTPIAIDCTFTYKRRWTKIL